MSTCRRVTGAALTRDIARKRFGILREHAAAARCKDQGLSEARAASVAYAVALQNLK
jgi:hypothetical protein